MKTTQHEVSETSLTLMRWGYPVMLWVLAIIFMMPIDYFVFDVQFPALWRCSVFSGLAALSFAYAFGVQMRALQSLKRRWIASFQLHVFVPKWQNVLLVVGGLGLAYLALVARTTPFSEFSWPVVRHFVATQPVLWCIEGLLLFALFFYALYLMLLVKRKVA